MRREATELQAGFDKIIFITKILTAHPAYGSFDGKPSATQSNKVRQIAKYQIYPDNN